jgi:GntR family transcriptional regulator
MYSENSIYKAGDFLNIILSNAVDQPIYVQIKNQIKEQILQGELKEKESLPSIRKLAKDIQVSVITTKKAYEELEKEGFIETFPGKGSFVAAQNPALLKDNQLKIIEDQMVTMLEQSKSFNISLEELIEMMKLLYEE